MEDQTPAAPSESSAYAKRPLWQWIALYAVIGVVVYGAIYYFFLAKKGGYTAPAETTPTVETATTPAPTPGPTSSGNVLDLKEASVSLTSTGFTPQAITIKVGTTVMWTNKSTTTGNVSSAPHPAHTDYPPLNLGNIPAGGTVSLTFNTPGTYKYHNHLDSSQYGSITVQ